MSFEAGYSSAAAGERPVARADDDVAIRVTNLSKCYHIYDHPQDRLKQSLVPRLQRLVGKPPTQYAREFWALKDVSFEVKKGETVGIIGRNGSGKSTLLQMICGTLTPTSGTIQTNGRVAALLELGAGFNPEFTGRENVYMASSIYGLARKDIESRFEDIATFADIGDFIEQPVKTYSSGMYVRLAFAVIVHVDADILLIDEALAVGDAVFIQKCMRFIRGFKEKGTLIFVSHDMASVSSLCRSAVWLDKGQLRTLGKAKTVSQAYLQHTLQGVYGDEAELQLVGGYGDTETSCDAVEMPNSTMQSQAAVLDYGSEYAITDNLISAQGFQTGVAELTGIEIENLTNPGDRLFVGGESVRVTVRARAIQPLDRPILGFVFNDRLGQALFGENTLPFTDVTPVSVAAGQSFFAEFEFRLPMLPNGDYVVFASVAQGELHNNIQHHLLHDALIVKVSSSKVRWGLVGVPFERVEVKVCK